MKPKEVSSTIDDSEMEFSPFPKLSGWKCYLFGNKSGGNGFLWEPDEKCVPNVLVRFFMKICLGCTWVKPLE